MPKTYPLLPIAIVVPTYNEVKNISNLVDQIFTILPKAIIVVVDDSSPDGTADKVKRLAKKHSQIKLVINPHKAGRGQAVLTGFKYVLQKTKAQVVVEMDADLSHRPQEIPTLIAQVKNKQFVVASRYLKKGRVQNWPWYRKFFSTLSNQLLKLMIDQTLTDYTNGFRAYSRQAIHELLKHDLVCKSYLTLTESALILKRAGYQIKEVPCIFPNRTHGKSNTNVKEVLNNIRELLILYKNYF